MQENGLITFFEIKECGFYSKKKLGNTTKLSTVHEKGNLAETLNKVITWAEKREFYQTLPFDADSSITRKKIYFKDYAKSSENEDVLIVFCEAFNNDKGKLSGFVEDAKVGSSSDDVIQVEKNSKGKKLIYAAPMYFWYIPEHNLIASIKFPHSVVSKDGMCQYLKRCIDNFIDDENKTTFNYSQYNHYAKRDIEYKRVTYKSPCGKFKTNFSLDIKMKELTIGDTPLENLAPQITHLVIRETISSEKEVEVAKPLLLWNKVNKKRSSIKLKKNVEIIEETQVSVQELRDILTVYNEENDKTENKDSFVWNDIGFRTNDDRTKWFSKYIDRRRIQLNPNHKIENSYFPAKIMLKKLEKSRDSLLDFSKIAVAENSNKKYGS